VHHLKGRLAFEGERLYICITLLAPQNMPLGRSKKPSGTELKLLVYADVVNLLGDNIGPIKETQKL
jgi:hypothetical protein